VNPQTLKYGKNKDIVRLDDSNTFLIESSKLLWGKNSYPPTIFIEGIDKKRIKFDFYKNYKNKDNVIMHCEYRSIHNNTFKLIIVSHNLCLSEK